MCALLCRYNVYTRLTSDAGTLLERLHWPPPLVQSKQQAPAPAPYANGLAAGASAAQHPQANGDMHAPPIGAGDPAAAHGEGAGAQGGEAVFSGFDSDQGVYAQLLAVLSCLTVLQQTVDTAAFAEQSTQAHGTDGAAQQQDSQQRVRSRGMRRTHLRTFMYVHILISATMVCRTGILTCFSTHDKSQHITSLCVHMAYACRTCLCYGRPSV